MATERLIASASPASLRLRCIAFAWDYLIISLYLCAVIGLVSAVEGLAPGTASGLFQERWQAQGLGFLAVTAPVGLYFALAERGARGATWGKHRVGLRVQRLDGDPLGLGRALARVAVKFTPWELAHTCVWSAHFARGELSPLVTVGLTAVWGLVAASALCVLLTTRRRALHDFAVGTEVVVGG